MDFTESLGSLADLTDSDRVPGIDSNLIRLVLFWIATLTPCLFTLGACFLVFFPSYFEDTPYPTGCRNVGLRTGSNLKDEHVSQETDDGGPHKGPFRVKSLWIYPVKGCQGVELFDSTVLDTGLQYDRSFSLAYLKPPNSNRGETSPKWTFLTQRENALLSQLHTQLWIPDKRRDLYSPNRPYVQSDGAIILTFPHPCTGLWGFFRRLVHTHILRTLPTKSVIIPYAPTPAQHATHKYPTESFTIWKDTVPALNMGAHLPPELAQYLGTKHPLSLFRVVDLRQVFRCAPRKEVLGYQPTTAFADAYPLNILGAASVRNLSSKIPQGYPALSARRFRPNIVFEGAEAYAEDSWKKIRIGEGVYWVVCRCVRCKVPNVDLVTGVRDANEPSGTIVREREIDKGAPRLGCLGMQMVPAEREGKIRVGDLIEVLEVGEHEYIKQ